MCDMNCADRSTNRDWAISVNHYHLEWLWILWKKKSQFVVDKMGLFLAKIHEMKTLFSKQTSF